MCKKNSYLIVIFFLMFPFIYAGTAKEDSNQLLGHWQCKGIFESTELIVESKTRLVLNGAEANYSLVPGSIRIKTEDGRIDYPYRLEGGILSLTVPDGTWFDCFQVKKGRETMSVE
ncbi:MAG: hypothetical protein IMF01_02720 [Proteobacteria bacterium]|nr:hypothetical protein [Pseudomonadota bacterium]